MASRYRGIENWKKSVLGQKKYNELFGDKVALNEAKNVSRQEKIDSIEGYAGTKPFDNMPWNQIPDEALDAIFGLIQKLRTNKIY